MNTVTIIGRLTRDPKMENRRGVKLCSMRLAESNGPKGSPLYIDVAAFGRQAETCMEFLTKGRQVAVVGRLRLSEWKDKKDQKRSEHSIAADRVDFLSGQRSRSE